MPRVIPTYQNDPGLALTYFYGHNEHTSEAYMLLNRKNLATVSSRIGHACQQYVVEGIRPDKKFNTIDKRLTEIMAMSGDEQSDKQIRGKRLESTLNLLRSCGRPAQFGEQKISMRKATSNELHDTIKFNNDLHTLQPWTEKQLTQYQMSRGTITELAFLAMGLLQPGIKQVMTPALLHHDAGHTVARNSFDLLLTKLRPEQDPAYYRLQVKAGCIGACTKDADQGAKLESYKTLYAPNIRLLSGHCDLKFPLDHEITGNEDRFSLASLLIKETFGTPSQDEIGTLEQSTSRVLRTIMLDDTRRGTAGGPLTYEESITA